MQASKPTKDNKGGYREVWQFVREGEKEDLRRFSDMLKDPPKLEDL